MVRIQKKARDVDLSVRKNVKGAGAIYSASNKKQIGDKLPNDITHLIIRRVMVDKEKEKQRNKEKLITEHKALYQETAGTCADFADSILAMIDEHFVPPNLANMAVNAGYASVTRLDAEYERILYRFRNDRLLLEPGAAKEYTTKFRETCNNAVTCLTKLESGVSVHVW